MATITSSNTNAAERLIRHGLNDGVVAVSTIAGSNVDEVLDREWQEALDTSPPVKAPSTRLLDLLDGWAAKAAQDPFPDSEPAKDRIADLYQEAGQFAFDDMSPEEEVARIRQFLLEEVLPALTM